MRALYLLCIGLLISGAYLVSRADDAQEIAVNLAANKANQKPNKSRSSSGRAFTVARHYDGHFYVNAKVEGRPVVFLVDTGASTVLLSQKDANRLGHIRPKSDYTHKFHTANGVTYAAKTKLDQIRIGGHDFTGVDAYIVGEGLTVSLLGQSILRRYQTVQMQQDSLELRW